MTDWKDNLYRREVACILLFGLVFYKTLSPKLRDCKGALYRFESYIPN